MKRKWLTNMLRLMVGLLVVALMFVMPTPSTEAGCYSYGHSYGYSYPSYSYASYSYPTYYSTPTYYPVYQPQPYAVPAYTNCNYTASVQDYYRDNLLSDSIAFKLLTANKLLSVGKGGLSALLNGDGNTSAPQTVVTQAQPATQSQGMTPDQVQKQIQATLEGLQKQAFEQQKQYQQQQQQQQRQQKPPTDKPDKEEDNGTPNTMAPASSQSDMPINTRVDAELVNYIRSDCASCHRGTKAPKGVNLEDPSKVPAHMRDRCFREVIAKRMPKGKSEPPEKMLAYMDRWCSEGWRADALARTARSGRAEAPALPAYRRLNTTIKPERDAVARKEE